MSLLFEVHQGSLDCTITTSNVVPTLTEVDLASNPGVSPSERTKKKDLAAFAAKSLIHKT